ncbi:GNAT family N-acetyltransferase [Rhodovibrio salinarum]|uniref:GNAT family N-acetyltransferase n=1 Tax=Rhodovibrio salinarum TaxID=1087 RepID=A0A934QHV3_9PROT|nr:GNAT family N-acetyltransferase [Rhodovibrio salinarum]MBK1696800.1 GNAT family N-acetyltransferase [Rhodovibrio salinarum]
MTPSSDDTTNQGASNQADGNADTGREVSDAYIQPAGRLDAPVIAALQNDVFPAEPWSESDVASLIQGPGAIAFLANGRDFGEVMPLGFVLARVAADEAEILTLGVLEDVRRKGLGRRLVESVADKARAQGAQRLHLEVAARNTAARDLYANRQFTEVGRRQNYYDDHGDGPDDAILLSRDLR